jgi:hypothetical protein
MPNSQIGCAQLRDQHTMKLAGRSYSRPANPDPQ